MSEDNTLILIDKNGKEKKYEIITSFYLNSTKKNYVVYTDNVKDEDGDISIYALIVHPDDDTKLEKVESEEEWKIIENILEEMKNKD